MSTTPIDLLERLAARQFGLFSAAQANELGIGRRVLSYYCRAGGRLRRPAPKVYEVAGSAPDWRRPLMAAQLWGGEQAVLSHRSAAALLDLDGADRSAVDLCRRRSTSPPGGWTVHRQAVPAGRIVTTDGLRHTDGLLTLADLTAVLDDDRWEWALESALRRRLVTPSELEAVAVQGDRHVERIRRVLRARGPGVPATGSIRETQFVQLARTVAVDRLERQVPVRSGDRVVARLDLAWPHLGVFIEIDGRWHDDPEAGPYDRHRQNEIVELLGWRPFRYDSDDIVRRPRYTARQVKLSFERARSGVWDQASPRT